MQNRNILFELLSIFSIILLLLPNVLIFGLSEITLIAFFFSRVNSFNRVNVYLALLLLLTQFLPLIINFGHLEFIEILKSVNFILLVLVVERNDFLTLMRIVKRIGVPLVLLMLLDGFVVDFIPNNHAIEMDRLLGVVPSTGLFYELDYAGIFNLLLFYLMPLIWLPISLAGILLSGFKTSIPFVLMRLVQFKHLLLKYLATFSVLLMPWVLYSLGPLVFEQRYYIWKSVINYLWGLRVYRRHEVETILSQGLVDSPWGFSGLNLHSGLFESLLYRGLPYTLISAILIFMAIRNSSSFEFRIILVFLGLIQMFSLSFGGTGFPSLFFTVIVIVNLRKNDTSRGCRRAWSVG